jgi:TPR repeat protein
MSEPSKNENEFKVLTLYLNNTKRTQSRLYYDVHNKIDGILKKEGISDEAIQWLMNHRSSEMLIVNAKVHYHKRMYKDTVKFLKKCKNDHYAIYLLGTMFLDGKGVKQDDNKAHTYFKLSAQKGNRYGQYQMGNICKKMRRQNEAIVYYKKSGDQGYCDALYELALIYENSNLTQAIECYCICYFQKHQKTLDRLKNMVQNTNDIDKVIKIYEKLPPDEVRQLLSILYYKKVKLFYDEYDSSILIQKGFELNEGRENAESLFMMGWFHPDESCAQVLFYEASQLGHIFALHEIGVLYEYDENYKDAFKIYSLASDRGNVHSKIPLAKLYLIGKGVEKDINRGIKLLTESNMVLSSHKCKNLDECISFGCHYYPDKYYKYMCKGYLGDAYSDGSCKNVRLSLKYYLECEYDLAIQDLLLSNNIYMKDVLNIKRKIDRSATALIDQDYIKYTRLYLKDIRRRKQQTIKILNRTSLYVNVLRDIIRSYI